MHFKSLTEKQFFNDDFKFKEFVDDLNKNIFAQGTFKKDGKIYTVMVIDVFAFNHTLSKSSLAYRTIIRLYNETLDKRDETRDKTKDLGINEIPELDDEGKIKTKHSYMLVRVSKELKKLSDAVLFDDIMDLYKHLCDYFDIKFIAENQIKLDKILLGYSVREVLINEK